MMGKGVKKWIRRMMRVRQKVIMEQAMVQSRLAREDGVLEDERLVSREAIMTMKEIMRYADQNFNRFKILALVVDMVNYRYLVDMIVLIFLLL